eukprot:gene23989-biopygen1308
MGPFASGRGYTRRCGAHFKPFLAGFGHQNDPKSIENDGRAVSASVDFVGNVHLEGPGPPQNTQNHQNASKLRPRAGRPRDACAWASWRRKAIANAHHHGQHGPANM